MKLKKLILDELNKIKKFSLAGHKGMVGSAIYRILKKKNIKI
jgi:hypothetical protein